MAYFVSAKDPYQGLYLFAVLPWYSRKEWRFHHQLCLSTFISALLIIKPCILCGWNGVSGGGEQPLPLALLTLSPARLPRVYRGGKKVFLFQQGPSATWGLHICGRNTVHGPFEVVFINIQFPLTQRATQQSSPSWSCMPIICRLKLLQCASPQWGLPYLEWACETIVVIIWGLRDFNKKLWHDRS